MIVGMAVVLSAAVANSTGLIVEKRALDRLPLLSLRRPLAIVRTLLTRPMWTMGFTLLLCGSALQVVGLALVPLSIAQPLFAVGLAVVLIVAAMVFAEPLSRTEGLGLASIAAAFTLLAFSLDPRTDKAGILKDFGALGLVLSAFAFGSVVVFAVSRPGAGKGMAVGLMNAVGGLSAKAAGTQVAGHRPTAEVAFSVTVLGISGVAMIGMTQIALQRGRAASVIPAQVVVGNVAAIAAGTLVFGERLPDTGFRLALRLAGLSVAILSLAIVQRGSRHRPRHRATPRHRFGKY